MEKHHRSAVSLKQTVGQFLIRRLKEAGISHMFGVPGDYNLEFLEQVEADKELVWVGCCNELNASYAADGYARTAGVSVLMTNYGVGELSALCGIAGAYAEHLSVVAISGAPPLAEIERNALLHHSAADGNFDLRPAVQRRACASHTGKRRGRDRPLPSGLYLTEATGLPPASVGRFLHHNRCSVRSVLL